MRRKCDALSPRRSRAPLPSFAGLKALVAFVEAGSMREAARRLETYPSNVARLIRDLEAQTGEELLQGARPHISASAQGLRLARAGSRAFALLKDTIHGLASDASSPQDRPAALDEEVGSLPYFTQLKALEAFARLGSFTAAALELRSTPSNVSRSLRLMETWSGLSLVDDQRTAAHLSRAGLRLAAAAIVAFDHIQEIVPHAARSERRLSRFVQAHLSAQAGRAAGSLPPRRQRAPSKPEAPKS